MERIKKIAVIMPCYNSSATLAETLDSVMAQTFDDFCLISINDGSTDETARILQKYALAFPNRVSVISQINQGQTIAKNVGIRNSQSEFIAFIDSDDLWAPDKLEKQVALLASRQTVGLCYTAALQINVRGEQVGHIGIFQSHRGRCFDALILGNNIIASSVMVRRAAVEQAGLYDESLRACENWDLWIRMAGHCEVDFIDEPLTSYRVHGSNMSKNVEKMKSARLQVIDKHLPENEKSPGLRALRREAHFRTHLSFAKGYIKSLQLVEARRELSRALAFQPAQARCYALYLKTLLGPRLFQWARARRGAWF